MLPKECQLNPPAHRGYHLRVNHAGSVTTLVVEFNANCGLQRHFSSVRIVLYCDASRVDARHTWAIRQLDPVHTSKHHVLRPATNDFTLPHLTIAFKIIPRPDGTFQYDHIPTPSPDELHRLNHKSLCVLLESRHLLTPETPFVSVAVTRTMRPTPVGGPRRRKSSIFLPTELVLKIFENVESCECEWQQDLLSFAQVCRQWSQCALKVLFARLEDMEWKRSRFMEPDQSLDPWGLAKALNEIPALGLGMQHLDINQHKATPKCQHPSPPSPEFIQALIAILRSTKNLQRLHLSLGYPSSWLANARFLALPELPYLHTLSITRAFCGHQSLIHSPHSINTTQLAHCMSRWSALTSLTVEDLKPGNIGIWRFSMRPPACALTQLCIRNSDLSDKDLLYLTASSVKTLTHVTVDHLWSVTAGGLRTFLESISHTVTSLTVRYTGYPKHPESEENPLDVVVDRMPRLETLNISGDIASEHMLRRRSEMFGKSGGSGVPVVRLSFEFVPRVRRCARREWPGWQVATIY